MLALALTVAFAPLPTNTPVRVYNYPNVDSCATWTDARRSQDAGIFEGWILGLVTGANLYGRGGGDIAPSVTGPGLFGWVDQYCATRPLTTVTNAGLALVQELHKQRSR